MSSIKVVDEIMGRGKTWASINCINSADEYTKFIVITPYLKEVDRYKQECKSKRFKSPLPLAGSKLAGIKDLIADGENIVSTHALLHKFDEEVIRMLKEMNYVLIMDEVTEVIEEYPITKDDLDMLRENYVDIEEKTGLLKWNENEYLYEGRFSDIKKLCELKSLAVYSGDILMWLFPVEVFEAFDEVYILTYMFSAQIQRYYYDFYNIPYSYCYVTGNSIDTYAFSDTPDSEKKNVDYRKLINICYHAKLNKIGSDYFALSKTWYEEAGRNGMLKQLKNNVYNYFRNIMNSKASENLWTTFSEYRSVIKGGRFSHKETFLELNARATNEKRGRTNLAYTVNRFLNPVIKNFFSARGIDVREDDYAVSEMVQFIWRSAIRDGKPVNIYIPSVRMRNLLRKWINEVSDNKENNVNEEAVAGN